MAPPTTAAPRAAPVVPEIARCVEEGLRLGLGPAIACVGSVRGQIFHRQALGRLAPPDRAPCANDSLFDLGALTMPLAAGVAALWGVGRRRVELTAPVGRVLEEFAASPWREVSLGHLLDHTSGLPPDLPLHAELAAAERLLHPAARTWGTAAAAPAVRRLLAARPPPPGGHPAARSGPGFMLLGWALERLLGAPLDRWLAATVLGPLGLADQLMYRPAGVAGRQRAVLGPVCPQRGRALRGEAADLNACALGGVAGHAGLFASAQGIWGVAQAILAAHHGDAALFAPATVMRQWSRGGAAGGGAPRRSIGFVTPQAALWVDAAAQFVGVVVTSQPTTAAPAAGMAPFLARLLARLVHASAAPSLAGDLPPGWQQLAGL